MKILIFVVAVLLVTGMLRTAFTSDNDYTLTIVIPEPIVNSQGSTLNDDEIIRDLINRDKRMNDERERFILETRFYSVQVAPESDDALGGAYIREGKKDYVFEGAQ